METPSGTGRRWPATLALGLLLGLVGGAILGRALSPAPIPPTAPPTAAPAPSETPPQAPAPTKAMPDVNSLPNVDVAALIDIDTPADVETMRSALLTYILGQPMLSDALPTVSVATSLILPGLDLTPLADFKVDRLTVDVPEGFTSINFLVHAPTPNHQMVVYHMGHEDFLTPQDFRNIDILANAGYDVVIMFMPFFGPNQQKVVLNTACCGPISLFDHDMMGWLEHPIRPFIYPLNAVVNYAEKQGYQRTYLLGFSGGGWTVTLYGALDTRPTGIAPVAGSQPLWFYTTRNDITDFEQQDPDLYRLATYEELYVMAAYGQKRWELASLNQFDSCCYNGTTYQAYESVVQMRVAALGAGEFSVHLDTKQQVHKFSQATLKVIMDRMARNF